MEQINPGCGLNSMAGTTIVASDTPSRWLPGGEWRFGPSNDAPAK